MADELSSLKAHFLASLNHEIRTPLSGIMGMTDLLLETRLSDEQKDYVTAARTCAESLLAMFNATLEFSDLSVGRFTLEEVEFDLPDTLRHTVGAFVPAAAAKGLRLNFRFDAGLPLIAVGDPLRLRQLLSYLIDNGLKFTHAGEVTVEAAAKTAPDGQSLLTVRVVDTGIGIPPEKLPLVFESFRQLDSGLSRGYMGLGLGLAVAQKLVQFMGGEICVESEPGLGSIFSVVTPLKLPAKQDAPAAPRILVVEDNLVAQRVATHILRRRRFDVTCVADGAAALGAASAHRFDLILMDLQMPGMDGFETTAAIRRLPGYERVPVLALTANATDEYRQRCLREGMQGFLAKPVEPGLLLETVSAHL